MLPRETEEKQNVIESSDPKQEKLVGSENYLGWSKLLKMELADRKYIEENIFVSATATKASFLIMKSISLKIAAMIPNDEGPLNLIENNNKYKTLGQKLYTFGSVVNK